MRHGIPGAHALSFQYSGDIQSNMPNHTAVIRHVPFEDLGLIGPILHRAAIGYRYYDLFDGAGPPDIASLSALILMGGPMSANDPLDYLTAERRLIDSALGRNIPVLGICLGAQLIAKALGANVYPNREREIGWFPLHWTDAAASDPLLSEVPDQHPVFHWHGETFDLPSASVWLASSARCRNQAFRHGDRTYAFQFHLETTPAMIADWLSQDINCGDLRETTEPVDPERFAAEQEQTAELVFGRWAERVRTGHWT